MQEAQLLFCEAFVALKVVKEFTSLESPTVHLFQRGNANGAGHWWVESQTFYNYTSC